MKFAVIENYHELPEKVKSLFVDTLFPNSRIGNINDPTNYLYQLDEMSIEYPKDDMGRLNLILHHRRDGTIIKKYLTWISDNVFEYSDVDRHWAVRIVDIDITRPWTVNTVCEYDDTDTNIISSNESISYLDIVNPTINYYIRRSFHG